MGEVNEAIGRRSDELLGSARDATRRLERAIDGIETGGTGDRRREIRLLLNLAGKITRDLELAEQHDELAHIIDELERQPAPEPTKADRMTEELSQMMSDASQATDEGTLREAPRQPLVMDHITAEQQHDRAAFGRGAHQDVSCVRCGTFTLMPTGMPEGNAGAYRYQCSSCGSGRTIGI